MSQVELEIDLEAEEMVEAEGSEAVGMTGGTQSSVMGSMRRGRMR